MTRLGTLVEDIMRDALSRLEPDERKRTIVSLYTRGKMSREDAAFWFYVFGIKDA